MHSTNAVEQRLTAACEDYCAGFIPPNTVNVRQLPSLSLQNTFTVSEQAVKLVFSPDQRLLAVVTLDQKVHIFRVDQNQRQFHWTLDLRLTGVSTVRFSWNSRFLLVAGEFQTCLEFWSLKARAMVHRLPLAKLSIDQEQRVAISESFIAAVAREAGESGTPLRERLAIYHVDRDSLFSVAEFPIDTNDAASVHFLPGNSHVLVVDSPLYPRAFVYGVQAQGERVSFSIDLPFANRLAVKHAAVIDDRCLAFGGFDGQTHIYELNEEMTGAGELKKIGGEKFVTSERVALFRESLQFFPSDDILQQLHVLGADINDAPVSYERSEISLGDELLLPNTKDIIEYRAGEAPKVGISQLAISGKGGRFLAMRTAEAANSIRVYDTADFRLLAVLLHRAPVRQFVWQGSRLAVATGESRVFVVDLESSACVGIFPVPIPATRLSWGERCLLVNSRDAAAALRDVAAPKGG